MAYQLMARIDRSEFSQSSLYHNTVVVGDGQTSDSYILPTEEILSVMGHLAGTGNLQYTIDPPGQIMDDAAVWVNVSDVENIPAAITGFRVVSTTGEVTGKLTLRTAKG